MSEQLQAIRDFLDACAARPRAGAEPSGKTPFGADGQPDDLSGIPEPSHHRREWCE